MSRGKTVDARGNQGGVDNEAQPRRDDAELKMGPTMIRQPEMDRQQCQRKCGARPWPARGSAENDGQPADLIKQEIGNLGLHRDTSTLDRTTLLSMKQDNPTRMQCMEVWGGNQSVERSVETAGLKIWVYSRPYGKAHSGGDVHYLSSCASGRITRMLLADVSGHGESVSQIAVALRDLMRQNVNYIRAGPIRPSDESTIY